MVTGGKSITVTEDKLKNYVVPHIECFKLGDEVVVTHFERERVLYVRPARADFSQIKRIEESAYDEPKLTDVPEVNAYVLAMSRGSYRRAQITEILEEPEDGNDILCSFIDYGYNEMVSSRDVKRMKFRTRGLPCQTFKVILNGVNTKNNVIIQNYLRGIKEQQEKLEVLSLNTNAKGLFVELKRKCEKITVNRKVSDLGNTRPNVDRTSKFARYD